MYTNVNRMSIFKYFTQRKFSLFHKKKHKKNNIKFKAGAQIT